MNHATSVDASVAVKWLFQEQFSDRARALFERSVRERRPLVVPPHFRSEVSNATYQRLRRRNITEAEAEEAVARFLGFEVQSIASPELHPRALTFARLHGLMAVYDSLYVVLAQMVQAELWTDDRRLLAMVGAAVPWVRSIGDYPL